MINTTLEYVCAATGGKLLQGEPSMAIRGVSTDSRNVLPSSLFFALEGENFDGHNYVLSALQAGADAACVSKTVNSGYSPEKAVILVPDTLQALQNLAGSYRDRMDIPVVGVTGSVGKTTTKDLIALCLAGRYKTFKSYGNFNNEIGLPLSLLQIDEEHEAAVVEMAMRQPGEIDFLARLARPSCAVITNAEAVHLETLGSLENIARAKCEILAGLEPGSPAVINGDCPRLVEISQEYPVNCCYFGCDENCHFRILSVRTDPVGMWVELSMPGGVETIYCPIPARLLAGNVVAAIAVASLWGVDIKTCQTQLLKYEPAEKRLNISRALRGGLTINDTYNANPVSMAAALECGQDLAAPGKWIAVLGDMFELGGNEIQGHLEVGKKAAACQVDLLVAVGQRAAYIARGAREAGLPEHRVRHFPSKDEALEFLKHIIEPQDKVLFKASRGMQMETLIEALEKP